LILDFFLILTIVFLGITIGVAIVYYIQIKKAQREYKKARSMVNDIVVSFNSQVDRYLKRLNIVDKEIEMLSFENEDMFKRLNHRDKRLKTLSIKLKNIFRNHKKSSKQLKEFNEKIENIATIQEKMSEKIGALEKVEYKVPNLPIERMEAVIPIKREKALAPLTETELRVLQILTKEGEKNTTEIKGKIHLSREHVSRLMKELYSNGYLERNTQKIPYVYRIKKEMLNILKKKKA
jgi:chromosome segregation ATPase